MEGESSNYDFKGVLFQGETPPDPSILVTLPEDLQSFYQECNGLVAFNGGLQIRICSNDDNPLSLGRYWKGDRALHRIYPNLLTSDIPFGQDCAGDQFFLRDDFVWLLSAETGEIMDMEVHLDEFFETSIEDPVDYLSMEPLVHYLDMEGELPFGQLVHIVPALSEDLPEEPQYHIDALPIDERLDWLAKYFNSLEIDS